MSTMEENHSRAKRKRTIKASTSKFNLKSKRKQSNSSFKLRNCRKSHFGTTQPMLKAEKAMMIAYFVLVVLLKTGIMKNGSKALNVKGRSAKTVTK